MKAKLFELRDAGTFLPVIAIKLDPEDEAERYLLARSGFTTKVETQRDYVLMAGLGDTERLTCDPFEWGQNRTRFLGHQHIIKNWNELQTGDVIDVEFIHGLRDKPKESERFIDHPEQRPVDSM
jgi:hypothetical protein